MKQVPVRLSVKEAATHLIMSLQEKGFTLFCDGDHQSNAVSADIELPASRALIFGNPVAGTMLMQKDITMSYDLPLRIALVDKDGQTILIHQTSKDYCSNYQVENHPVLEKIDTLFSALTSELG